MNAMTDHPILFSAAMVQAILAGRKTQTRRVIKPQPFPDENRHWYWKHHTMSFRRFPTEWLEECPYGVAGNQLWVRETWRTTEVYESVYYKADQPYNSEPGWGWKPSIHMPRHRSRITLEIVNVRAERLQDILNNDVDVYAEGCPEVIEQCGPHQWFQYNWDAINTKRGLGWATNPWCWIINFKRIKP